MNGVTNVLMYVKSNDETPVAQQLLLGMPGIRRVRRGKSAAGALLVDYEHARISAQHILAGLHNHGVTASLVGM